MRRWILVAVLSCLVAACSSAGDQTRYQFGVSGDRPATEASADSDQAMKKFLDAKANQICTHGYEVVKVETLGAQDGKQLVDLDLRCNAYRPSVLPLTFSSLF